MSDFDDDKNTTPEERAQERAHYLREDRLDKAAHLTHSALQHGGLSKHEVSDFLRTVHGTLTELGAPPTPVQAVEPEAPAAPEPLKPAVPVKKSVTDDAIISLIDGKPRQTLTRHLKLNGHTPESYRAAFGLPASYPMVCVAHTRKRAEIARAQGLGKPKATNGAAEPAATH